LKDEFKLVQEESIIVWKESIGFISVEHRALITLQPNAPIMQDSRGSLVIKWKGDESVRLPDSIAAGILKTMGQEADIIREKFESKLSKLRHIHE